MYIQRQICRYYASYWYRKNSNKKLRYVILYHLTAYTLLKRNNKKSESYKLEVRLETDK